MTRGEIYLDFVAFVRAHYEIMGYSAWLEFARHSKRKGITSGFTGALSHHEGSFRLLAQHFQRYFPGIINDHDTVKMQICIDK